MAEEVRVTQMVNDERHTVGQEGVVNGAYFQLGYFQSDYFQAGFLQISSNTDCATLSLTKDRITVRLD